MSKPKDEFQFIPEKPLKANEDISLLFGHKDIVSVLEKMIKKAPDSFTIGLYGDWGTGKSSIAFSLKEKIKKEIPLVIFDVWKHEGDSLRRTFLSLLINDLKEYPNKFFQNNYKIDDRYNNSRVINEEKRSINKYFKTPAKILLILLVVTLLSSLILDYFIEWLGLTKFIGNYIIALISLYTIPTIIDVIKNFIETKTIITTQDKFTDPYEFENEFRRILKEGLKTKKLVIVFDNLDRVNGEKALEIMSTIKTFLDPIDESIKGKEVTFIIPCDEKAIKRHLKNSLNYNGDNSDYERYSSEYLRKFFNTIIWIPEFYGNELEKLAYENLKASNIDELVNEDIAALIVFGFDKNPRQIIQYVNILISNYLLIKERNISGFDLQNELPQFAKYLLLIQKFPDVMEYLKCKLIYDVEEIVSRNFKEIEELKDVNQSEFNNFLESTNHIIINSLDIFFKLRKSEFEEKFNNSDRLIRIIENLEIKNIVKSITVKEESKIDTFKTNPDDIDYLNNLNIQEKLNDFNSIIRQKLSKKINQVIISRFIDGLLFLTRYYNIKLQDQTYRGVLAKLKEAKHYIYTIDSENLVSQIFEKVDTVSIKNQFIKEVKKQWIDDFLNIHYDTNNASNKFSDEYLKKLEDRFIENNKYFEFVELESVRIVFAEKYFDNVTIFERVSGNKRLRHTLSSSKYLVEILRTTNVMLDFDEDIHTEETLDNLMTVNKVLDIVSQYEESYYKDDVLLEINKYLVQYINSINRLTYDEGLIVKLIDSLYKLFDKIHSHLNKLQPQPFSSLFDAIKNSFTYSNYIHSFWFFKFLYTFKEIKPDDVTLQKEINSILYAFFGIKIEANTMLSIIKSKVDVEVLFENDTTREVFLNRALNENDYLNVFYSFFNADDKHSLIRHWMSNDISKTINLLEMINYNVPYSDKTIDETLDLIEKSNIVNKEFLYNIISNIKTSINYDYSKYSSQIIKLITSPEIAEQELGLKEIEKNKKHINQEELKNLSEKVLKESYLREMLIYGNNVMNILKTNFYDNKKFLNNVFKEDESLIENLSNYFFTEKNIEFFNFLSSLFYKVNKIKLSKSLLKKYEELDLNDKNVFNNIRPFLENILKNEHSSDYRNEIKEFIEIYKVKVEEENFEKLIIDTINRFKL